MSKIMIGTDEVLKVMFGLDEVSSLSMGGETIPITPPTPPAPDYSTMPFTIEALESGNFNINLAGVDYSTDDGNNWDTTTGVTTFNLSEGDAVQFKRNSQTTAQGMFSGNTAITFNVYGNIMSLLYGDNFIGEVTLNQSAVFSYLFNGSSVVDVSELHLPALTLANYCYQRMFYDCTNLTIAPSILPALTLTNYCYSEMFYGCTNLTIAPELPATTLVASCYQAMFRGSSKLQYIKCMATNNADGAYTNMWVRNISATGTFVKDANATWPSGRSGIPTGWTVVDA